MCRIQNKIIYFLGAGVEAGATAIDEDLFEDEDLDELEEDLNNLDVWKSLTIKKPIHPVNELKFIDRKTAPWSYK